MDFAGYVQKGNCSAYRRGTVFFAQGDIADQLYLITEGVVKLSVFSELGEERITEFVKAGRFLGAPDFFCECRYGIAASAYTHVKMIAFSRQQVRELLGTDPDFSYGMATSLSKEIRAIGGQLIGETFLPAKVRVGMALQNLKGQIGTPAGDGTGFMIPITQSDLAFFVGCNRVTVTKALHELTCQNLIEKKTKKIMIKDLPKLNHWLKTETQK